MSNNTDSLEWIKPLLASLPELPAIRKDIFTISGFPNWENVHSNLLAFYFDENAEHGFGRLFLDSLLNLCEKDLDVSSDYCIEREYVCKNTKKRLDLLLISKDDDWAIIIENKIYAQLYNNLKAYWNVPKHIDDKNKIGIVLSLNKISIPANDADKFINITHRELLTEVQNNLGKYIMSADDRHLLILQEYIANIENRGRSQKMINNLEKELECYAEYASDIDNLLKRREKTKQSITKAIRNAMKSLGYSNTLSKDIANREHYYADELKQKNGFTRDFRFWIHHKTVLDRKQLNLRFEFSSTKKAKIYRKKLLNELREKINSQERKIYLDSKEKGIHIVKIETLPLFDESITGDDFEEKFKNLIETLFFDDSEGLVELAHRELKKLEENKG